MTVPVVVMTVVDIHRRRKTAVLTVKVAHTVEVSAAATTVVVVMMTVVMGVILAVRVVVVMTMEMTMVVMMMMMISTFSGVFNQIDVTDNVKYGVRCNKLTVRDFFKVEVIRFNIIN